MARCGSNKKLKGEEKVPVLKELRLAEPRELSLLLLLLWLLLLSFFVPLRLLLPYAPLVLASWLHCFPLNPKRTATAPPPLKHRTRDRIKTTKKSFNGTALEKSAPLIQWLGHRNRLDRLEYMTGPGFHARVPSKGSRRFPSKGFKRFRGSK